MPPDGNLADIAAAGGLHTFQLDLHELYGPVARFELPGTRVVSVADPELLAVTSRINRRPDELFEFLSPLFEAGNLQTIPEREHVPWRRLLLSALGNHRPHEAHFDAFTRITLDLADRWAVDAGEVALQEDLSELSLRLICEFALGSELGSSGAARRTSTAFRDVLAEHLGRQYGLPSAVGEARAAEALAHLRQTVTRILDARRAGPDRPRADLVSMLADSDWDQGHRASRRDGRLPHVRRGGVLGAAPAGRPSRDRRAGDGRDQAHACDPAETVRVRAGTGSRGHAGRAIRVVGARRHQNDHHAPQLISPKRLLDC
jgi:hypothetical protein